MDSDVHERELTLMPSTSTRVSWSYKRISYGKHSLVTKHSITFAFRTTRISERRLVPFIMDWSVCTREGRKALITSDASQQKRLEHEAERESTRDEK